MGGGAQGGGGGSLIAFISMTMDTIFIPTDYFRVLGRQELFSDDRPLEVDLGCGDGSFLEEMAAFYPERNFLGVERLIGRVEKTARRLQQRGLTNARVLRLESVYALGWMLPESSVSRLHLLCPDPWPKKKHHDRRIYNNSDFHGALTRVLVPEGELLLKSDDLPYYESALEVMSAHANFEKLDWPENAFPYPLTDFEQQWLALSKTMHRARWKKLAA